jgi:hypothetical protein
MFLVVEKMGTTAVDDELLLVFCRLVGGAVGEPPVLFAEDIFQNEASKIFARSGLKKWREAPKWLFTNEMEEKTTLTFDEWTLDFKVNLHHTTQTRRNTMPKAIGHALITFCNSFRDFFRSFTIVWLPNFCESSATFQLSHSERKQDLTTTNQNTRSTTRRHSKSCILVPRHGRAHGNHSRRLKSPIRSKFTILDPFYPRPFAFLFGLPAVPYWRGGTQCPKTDFSINTFAKPL